ncbi:hypothetical protein LLT5_02335 [Lactococcus cremoris subsp. cremoris TIFN5]|nr:hypothetical protein LLT5_14035 [Lactococcus cremoris subsp. cremoris TIFN5]EQC55305.1 hypothetical protein LLT5_02335 [Lactococcus cremoris subsp. cremoris TIFN5]
MMSEKLKTIKEQKRIEKQKKATYKNVCLGSIIR